MKKFTPRKRDESREQQTARKIEFPNNGREFFFSNILIKIYQVPVLFLANSEEANSEDSAKTFSNHESSFIVLFYEKNMRKRTFAKNANQKQKLIRLRELKQICESMKNKPMILEELMPNRDSKMRRFCNYFLTLFNQKKLNPFTQFVQSKTLKGVKLNVRLKMQHFTKGVQQHVKHIAKKDIKKSKTKGETKAQRIPKPQQINNLVQHDRQVMISKNEDLNLKNMSEKDLPNSKKKQRTKSSGSRNSSIHQAESMDDIIIKDHKRKTKSQARMGIGAYEELRDSSMEFGEKPVQGEMLIDNMSSINLQRSAGSISQIISGSKFPEQQDLEDDPQTAYGVKKQSRKRVQFSSVEASLFNHRGKRNESVVELHSHKLTNNDSLKSLMQEFMQQEETDTKEKIQIQKQRKNNVSSIINALEKTQKRYENIVEEPKYYYEQDEDPPVINGIQKNNENDEGSQEKDFKLAKYLSFDFTSEFKDFSPRPIGQVEKCRIGDPELVEFKELTENKLSEEDLTINSKGQVINKKLDKIDQTGRSESDYGESIGIPSEKSIVNMDEGNESVQDDNVSGLDNSEI